MTDLASVVTVGAENPELAALCTDLAFVGPPGSGL